jgi:hypothetical protein
LGGALGWPRSDWYKIEGIATRYGDEVAMKWGLRLDIDRSRWRGRAPVAATLVLALFAAGCSSSGGLGGQASSPAPAASAAPAPAATTSVAPAPPPATTAASPQVPSAPSLKDKIAGFFSGKSATAPQAVANAPQARPDVACPFIDVRAGASTLTVPPPNGENSAMALKYQGTFVRAARECSIVAGQMVIKIGVQGRLIVGPAGGPGHVDVPLRIAVVSESPANSKLIATKLVRIPVEVTSADDNPIFTHIEEGLSFPLPPDNSIDNYIVYIGFDPAGAEAQDTAKPAPKAKPKPKSNPNAPTG